MVDRTGPGRAATFWHVLLIVTLVVAAHHDIFTIPFSYSEIGGIQRNPVVTSPHAFVERMLTPKGLLQRPLSVLTYMLNYAVHGEHVAGYHLTNLVIHCANTVLVYLLARAFFAAPLVAGLVFGLHPLATACVSQIFGRNYSLATTFFLVALYGYLRWRRRGTLTVAQLAIMIVLFLLAILTKQTMVMLPIVVAWHEIGVRNLGFRDLGELLGSSWRTAFVAACAVVLGLELIVLYAVPLSKTASIAPATFFLSQVANAPVVARFFLLPYETAFIHDLYLYRDLAHVEVWMGFMLLGMTGFVAYRWRTRPVGWLLGALLICLLPTNSVLPKNELVREWRLYPSLVFYALLVAEAVAAVAVWLRTRVSSPTLRAAPYAAVACYVATFAHSDILQNRVYQSELGSWQQVLARYPYSADAMNNIGIQHYKAGNLSRAVTYFQMASDAAPEVSLYRHNLAQTYKALGDYERAQENFATAKELAAQHGRRGMALHYR